MATRRASWTFLTSHTRVLVRIARDPAISVRDIAAHCLITERTAQRIISELEQAGYLTHTRAGRANRYCLIPGGTLRHPAEAHITIDDLLALFTAEHPRAEHSHAETATFQAGAAGPTLVLAHVPRSASE
ncbi:helix-turn-helix transcriptional regulator [Streptacidiphilus neutrinimicus]|uniref:helix-turn-helix transcriptional regulator n=1 Tax=Streptacidiphilus neutrinimicus TaxID=105420 RepID=UPI0007C73218|nr:helix-turn-helix domain-containing protein [Streptacidiphilus neutrinimicus]